MMSSKTSPAGGFGARLQGVFCSSRIAPALAGCGSPIRIPAGMKGAHMKHSLLLTVALVAVVQSASALTYVFIPPELKAAYDQASAALAQQQSEKGAIDGMLADLWKQAAKITEDIKAAKDPADKAILQSGYMACLRMIGEYEAKRKQAEAQVAAATLAVAEAKAKMDAGTKTSQVPPTLPSAGTDPNAPFRPTGSGLAEPMPPDVTGGSSYVPGSKPGETPGMTVNLPGWAQTTTSQGSAGSTTPTAPPPVFNPGFTGPSDPGWAGTLPGVNIPFPPILAPGGSGGGSGGGGGGHTHSPTGQDVPMGSSKKGH